MQVVIEGDVYEVDRLYGGKIIQNASKHVPKGIYAVKQGSVAILKNEPYMDDISLHKAITDYREQGFKVYYNE